MRSNFLTIFTVLLLGELTLFADRIQSAPVTAVITNIRVIDGDTVAGSIDGAITSVRLCGIDAPERRQLLGSDATKLLRTLIKDKSITVAIIGRDRYRRTIGSLYADGSSVQSLLASSGAVLFYSASNRCPDRQLVIDSENYARSQKLGIHAIDGFVPPWEFRRKSRLKKLS